MKEEKKKSKIHKMSPIERKKVTLTVCDCPYYIAPHVYLKGAISLARGKKEGEKVELNLPLNLIP